LRLLFRIIFSFFKTCLIGKSRLLDALFLGVKKLLLQTKNNEANQLFEFFVFHDLFGNVQLNAWTNSKPMD
jgi:hypothetical protein